MPDVRFEGLAYACEDSETVLSCLERNGIEVQASCRVGVCQTCIMRSVNGDPPELAQQGLKEILRAQGYFLPCVCVPSSTLEVTRGGLEFLQTVGRIASISRLNETVVKVEVACDDALDYQPGQFLNFLRPDGLVRSYSIASVPKLDMHLAFHVALVPDGRMSGWIHNEASPGDELTLLGPQGECFYVEGQPDQPMFLLGTGTGLAPLYGIVRDAIAKGHSGPIHLFQGSPVRRGLYLVEELRALERQYEQFYYHPCVLEGGGNNGVHVGPIDAYSLERFPDLSGWRVFLSGNPDLVRLMQRKTYLAGANLNEIVADAFVISP